MSNINIMVDTNLLFHRWAHMLAKKNTEYLTKDNEMKELVQGVHFSLQNDISKYKGMINRIMLFSDSKKKSWRKLVPVEDGEQFYKSHKKKDKFNYDRFLQAIEEYTTILKEKNVYCIQFDHAEADDLLYLATKKMYDMGQSSIVISSDSDLRQFIKSEEGKFIYIYDANNMKKRHIVDKKLGEIDINSMNFEEEKVTDASEFSGIFDHDVESLGQATFDGLLNNIYDGAEIVTPSKYIFIKMLSGDVSDNVPSSYIYKRILKSGKEGKPTSFTEKRAEDLWDKYHGKMGYNNPQYYIDLYDNEEMQIDLAFKMQAEVGVDDKNDIPIIMKGIKRNLKFVHLHENMMFPEHYNKMNKYLDAVYADTNYYNKHQESVGQYFGASLLAGSKYEYSSDGESIRYDSRQKFH